MAKEIARLLRTDMMADMTMPALAQLLQKKGRGKDTILAHITPSEARKLKRDGGAGTINPDTGLPEFLFEGDDYIGEPEAVAAANPDLYQGGVLPNEDQYTQYDPASEPAKSGYTPFDPNTERADYTLTPAEMVAQNPSLYAKGLLPGAGTQTVFDRGVPYEVPRTNAPAAKTEEGMSDKTKEMLLKGALGLGTGLVGAYAGRKAAQQAQAAKGELSALGAPYQQKGKELQDAALRGELTPAGQKQVQAARAQLAQGVEKRGGVGAAQAATQLAGFKQQLLDTQYNYGLKIAQIGDSYAANAIRLGLTQDREMATLMGGLTSAAGSFIGGQPNVPGR